MQSILLPPTRSGGLLSLSPAKISATHLSLSSSPRQYVSFNSPLPFSSPLKKIQSLTPIIHTTKILASAPISTNYTPSDDTEKLKLAQVAKRLENTSRYLKRLGSFGFWGQLVCTIVAAVILSFSIVVTGKVTSPATFYATAGGIAAGFISVFWSFGYIRLADKLKRTANNPVKAPPRADVVNSLKNGIVLNLLGMGAAVLGMQATVGFLVAKALTTSSNPFYQGVSPGSSPVLALDVFLVQASANTILSHFLGLVCSLELLRSVTVSPNETIPAPKMA
ncbi:hypothetical protein DCAR_0101599 [Daucus carota subsp. sativus]|uniref:Translocon at inner membrane of chloroplasts 21 n=1 Tax=Daucus carota subsp. sativus TaxID=79200 RepID=A0AAF0W6A7_DAUCS|nr:PREDICTED: protein TIC 21, chloroplastic [Daucus carota subsp. sativus]WOG82435.1 hypothetical protein DCAR_0101599 [Daucus carota subsp. sativus]